MKFLPKEMENRVLMPIKFQYERIPLENPTPYNKDTDVLYVTYKDMESNEKHVEIIEKPMIEIYIVKPEFRGTPMAPADRFRDYIELEYLQVHKVHYRTRKAEAAKLAGIRKEDVDVCPFIIGLDVNIKTFYFIQFKKEYGNDTFKNPSICFADIETEIKDAPYVGIAPAGTVPISVITLIDSNTMKSYTFCLYFPKYGGFDEFWEESNLNDFIKELNDSFDSTYGHIEYNLMLFNTEIELISAFWSTVNTIEPDFLEWWNMPFDMSNIIARCITLGFNPGEIARNPKFNTGFVEFKEDHNHIVHKRKHLCELPTTCIIVDQMVNYAVIRSAGSKIPTFKLNAIADAELKDKKVEYAEDYGNIADFPYKDYRRFIKYNIKDVLLQYGIEKKTMDTMDIYGRMYDFCVDASSINTTTDIVAHHYMEELNSAKFGYKIMHRNRNKIEGLQENINVVYDQMSDNDEDEFDLDAALQNVKDTEVIFDEKGNKIKFDGAIVLNPTRMSSSGFDKMKYIHNNVCDEDITSEYPSGMSITNNSNETFIGKVIMDDPDAIKLDMYNGYYFANSDEKASYKPKPVPLVLETFAQGDVLIGMDLAFGLGSVEDVFSELDLSKIIKE